MSSYTTQHHIRGLDTQFMYIYHMYMTQEKSKEFEWDSGNIDKNYEKHGVSPNEAEEVFLDRSVIIVPDIVHSYKEVRLIAIGLSGSKHILFVVFTRRAQGIRIISARRANKKERRLYEEKKF